METTGTIHFIGEKKRVSDKFTVQEFVIETDEKYPQKIVFNLINDKVNLINGYQSGDTIKVAFNLTGREYNGKYYNTLSCWKIQPINGVSNQENNFNEFVEDPF